MTKWHKIGIFVVAVTVTCVLFVNFCNLVFQCGCTYLWAGGGAHCNIHHGPKHCPWCVVGYPGQAAIWLSMVIPQGWLSFRTAAWRWPLRLLLALAAFPAIGAVAALMTGLYQGYWRG